jgi:hypothetical protein
MKLDNITIGSRLFLDDQRTILVTKSFSFVVEKVRKFDFENGSKLILAEIRGDDFNMLVAQKSIGDLVDYKAYDFVEFVPENSRENHLISNPWLLSEDGFHEVIESENAVYVKKNLPEVTNDGEFDCFVAEYSTNADLENNELLIIETGQGWIEFFEGRIISEFDLKVDGESTL